MAEALTFTDGQEVAICRNYQAGETLLGMASALGCAHTRLLAVLAKHRIPRRSPGRRRGLSTPVCTRLADGQASLIVGLCEAGRSVLDIAMTAGLPPSVIAATLHGLGLSPKPLARGGLSLAQVRSRVPRQLDERAFDCGSPEANYWTGFMMADGTICQAEDGTPDGISLALARRDLDHVESFRNFLRSHHTISLCKGPVVLPQGTTIIAERAVFSVTSRPLADALIRRGVGPRKSLTAKVVGLESDRDFWRGCIDGDGCLGWTNRPRRRPLPTLQFIGSYPMCLQFADYIRATSPSWGGQPYPKDGVFAIGLAACAAAEVTRALYEDCGMALARKLAIAHDILKWRRVKPDRAGLTLEKLDLLYVQHGTWAAVAASVGMTLPALYTHRHRLIRHPIRRPPGCPRVG